MIRVAEYYLLDIERTIGYSKPYFWKGTRHGYTTHIEQAGIFPEDRANEIIKNDRDKTTVKISTSKVFKLMGKDMKKPHEGTTFY
jgi:hypothetical protein